MKVLVPVTKLKQYATDKSVLLSEKTYVKADMAGSFLSGIADITLFIMQIIRETFSSRFELREFLRQCFQIGYKSLPLIVVTGAIMGIVLTIQTRPSLAEFGAVTLLPGMVTVSIIRI